MKPLKLTYLTFFLQIFCNFSDHFFPIGEENMGSPFCKVFSRFGSGDDVLSTDLLQVGPARMLQGTAGTGGSQVSKRIAEDLPQLDGIARPKSSKSSKSFKSFGRLWLILDDFGWFISRLESWHILTLWLLFPYFFGLWPLHSTVAAIAFKQTRQDAENQPRAGVYLLNADAVLSFRPGFFGTSQGHQDYCYSPLPYWQSDVSMSWLVRCCRRLGHLLSHLARGHALPIYMTLGWSWMNLQHSASPSAALLCFTKSVSVANSFCSARHAAHHPGRLGLRFLWLRYS